MPYDYRRAELDRLAPTATFYRLQLSNDSTGERTRHLNISEEERAAIADILDPGGTSAPSRDCLHGTTAIAPPARARARTTATRPCPSCGKDTSGSEEWSTGQCDDCFVASTTEERGTTR